jgi:hypothetical protein
MRAKACRRSFRPIPGSGKCCGPCCCRSAPSAPSCRRNSAAGHCRAVALDIGIAGKLSDSALRLLIGAISGGTIVPLFATGLLPSLHTGQGEQDGVHAMAFVMLLGIVAGFVEQLVPSLLENQADRFRNGDDAKKATAILGRGGDKTG